MCSSLEVHSEWRGERSSQRNLHDSLMKIQESERSERKHRVRGARDSSSPLSNHHSGFVSDVACDDGSPRASLGCPGEPLILQDLTTITPAGPHIKLSAQMAEKHQE